VHFATDHPNGPLMWYEGNVSVDALSVADRDQGDEVASLQSLSLNGVRVTVDPTTVSIHEVGLQQPLAHLVVLSDGGLNLGRLAVPPPSSAPKDVKPEPQKAKGPAVPITVGTVELTKAALTFRDESVRPPVQTGLSALTGTIKGLSSKRLARADVDLTGRVGTAAPLKIFGTINPLSENAFTDLIIILGGLDLTVGGPYSGKYVGYGLSKGKLSLDLKYKVSQKQLHAENKVLVDQLTFGRKVESPDATSLPVPLVVALLKDRNGRINIDLPIRGDLNDPDFKYGKVVLSTLLNLVTKIVASPFSLMGKLIPGGGDEEALQFVAFPPGSTTVADGELKKLEALAKGLEERPNLRLDITGTADSVRDRQALNRMKLQAIVQAKWQRERGKPTAKGEPIPAGDEQRLIQQLYEEHLKKAISSAAPPTVDPSAKPLTYEEQKQVLIASMPLDEEALRGLALQRAEQVREQLTGKGKLADEQVYLLDVDLNTSDHEQIRSRLAIEAAP
jgi:outer membrane protein OmpA-like peptidoglycan-associated protein